MVKVCSVVGCKSKYVNGSGITFHQIPKNEIAKQAWLQALRRQDWINFPPRSYSHCYVCSSHFKDEDFDRFSMWKVRLKEEAVPSNFPAFPAYLRKVSSLPRRMLNRTKFVLEMPDGHCSDITNPDVLLEISSYDCAEVPIVMEPVALEEIPEEEFQSVKAEPEILGECAIEHSYAYTSDVEQVSPRKKILKRKLDLCEEKLDNMKKKLRNTQRRERRYKRKVANLKDIINNLKVKKFMADESLNVLQHTLPPSCEALLKRQHIKLSGAAMASQYPAVLRVFALTLHFYSPKAYSYVRRTFSTCLPHPRTIARWYQNIDAKAGFSQEALQALTAKCSEMKRVDNKTLYVTLLMDEMSIRKHIEFDGKKFYGYVDMGTGIDDDSLPLARNALVFMIVSINDRWKLPIAYFLVDGIKSTELAGLVKTALRLLADTGAEVIALTFDGLSTNLAVANELGCCLDIGSNNFRSSFTNPSTGNAIAVFLDPCHMLKLLRNAFAELNMMDKCGNVISYKYVEQLHSLQEREGLHLANKLRTSHLAWNMRKMNVKLAAQLLSGSVADALDFCRVELKIQEFEQSAPTAKFIRLVDRLFDVLNSRSFMAKDMKLPVSLKNFSVIAPFLNEAEEYLSSLKDVSTASFMHKGKRHTAFQGFITCIHSLRLLADHLLQTGKLRFIPTYKIGQDHLELFFSMVRSQGGNNDNPTVRQFQSAFRKLLVHNEVSEVDNGNCLPVEAVSILHLSTSIRNPEKIINQSAKKSIIELSCKPQLEDHDYFIFSCATLSRYCEEVVYFVAGNVIRQVERTLLCGPCLSVLRGPEKVNSLTFKKTLGRLIYPSEDVYVICLQSEKIFRKAVAENDGKFPSQVPMCSWVISVLQCFVDKPVFVSLASHDLDHSLLDNHSYHLVKLVAMKYLKIRCFHAGKQLALKSHIKRIRSTFTKLIHFKGQ